METEKIEQYPRGKQLKIGEHGELNLKPFDLKAAKAGNPVCTRGGRKARIICFDAKFSQTGNIVTLIEKETGEEVTLYHYDDGHCSIGRAYDLMMLPKKKEGWAVVRRCDIYETEEQAKEVLLNSRVGITIKKIEWEE